MTPRQLALIALAFAALLLLWGAAAVLRRADGAAAATVPPALPRAGVDTVVIARPADTTILARRDSAVWTVNRYRADPAPVGRLLDALADTLRRTEPVAERPASHAGLGVDSAAGSRVRVAGAGGVLADLVMGQRSPDLDGGYFRRAADSTVYLVRGPLAELLGQAPDEWRDRRMASVPADSVVEVEVHRGRSSYRLAREGGGWRFGRGGALADSAAVRSLLGAYARLDADGFASEAQSDSARWDRPERRVRLFRADGSPLITLLADSAAGGFWARVDSGEVVYRLESWTVDRLAPPDTTLRATPG